MQAVGLEHIRAHTMLAVAVSIGCGSLVGLAFAGVMSRYTLKNVSRWGAIIYFIGAAFFYVFSTHLHIKIFLLCLYHPDLKLSIISLDFLCSHAGFGGYCLGSGILQIIALRRRATGS